MDTANVAIIDSGGANIASLQFALDRLNASSTLTSDPDTIHSASHVVLPGVGSAADAMARIRQENLQTVIPALKQPVLGICLGMQLLAEHSEEHDTRCLGVVPGISSKLSNNSQNRVPNMGWSRVRVCNAHHLLNGIGEDSYFYFLHSYALPLQDYTVASSAHSQPFTAVLSWRNFYATQFHPERSAAAGARLLKNFLELG